MALIICTKDRPFHMENLIKVLLKQILLPQMIVVVDSSSNDLTFRLSNESSLNLITNLIYIKSSPGLPKQRNIGIDIVNRNLGLDELRIVSFVDDDIDLDPDYFFNLSSDLDDLDDLDDFVAITGLNHSVRNRKVNVFHRLFLLTSKIPGRVLSSGQVSQPYSNEGVAKTDWIPGLSMNICPKVLKREKFDETIRMYGEDLEFSLRLNRQGKLYCSHNLNYRHYAASEGREDVIKVTAFTDGILWKLAGQYPQQIQRKAIIWSVLGLVLLDLLKLSTLRGHRARVQRILGHLIFISRITLGKNPAQENV